MLDCIEYYLFMKKNEIAICENVDGPGIMLSEISQTKKDKCHVISLICGINKAEQNRNRLINTENKLMIARGEGDG